MLIIIGLHHILQKFRMSFEAWETTDQNLSFHPQHSCTLLIFEAVVWWWWGGGGCAGDSLLVRNFHHVVLLCITWTPVMAI